MAFYSVSFKMKFKLFSMVWTPLTLQSLISSVPPVSLSRYPHIHAPYSSVSPPTRTLLWGPRSLCIHPGLQTSAPTDPLIGPLSFCFYPISWLIHNHPSDLSFTTGLSNSPACLSHTSLSLRLVEHHSLVIPQQTEDPSFGIYVLDSNSFFTFLQYSINKGLHGGE